jgi:hypothetical protein
MKNQFDLNANNNSEMERGEEGERNDSRGKGPRSIKETSVPIKYNIHPLTFVLLQLMVP